MSYQITIHIMCDAEGCTSSIKGHTDVSANKTLANQVAAQAGWIKKGKSHICNHCAKRPIIRVKQPLRRVGRGMGI